jgi:hypothetical protein
VVIGGGVAGAPLTFKFRGALCTAQPAALPVTLIVPLTKLSLKVTVMKLLLDEPDAPAGNDQL